MSAEASPVGRVTAQIQLALILCAMTAATVPGAEVSLHEAFNSQQAYAYTAEVAGFGERWPGSPGHKKRRT
jgi:hypothetical protein